MRLQLKLFILIGMLCGSFAYGVNVYIEGWVYDSQTNVPIKDANVILDEHQNADAVITTVRSDPSGYYRVFPACAGPKHFYVWAPGYGSTTATVIFENESTRINYFLLPASRILGFVSNEFNVPIANALVQVEYLDNRTSQLLPNILNSPGISDQDGRLAFRTVQPFEPLRMTITHPDYDIYVSSIITLAMDELREINVRLLKRHSESR